LAQPGRDGRRQGVAAGHRPEQELDQPDRPQPKPERPVYAETAGGGQTLSPPPRQHPPGRQGAAGAGAARAEVGRGGAHLRHWYNGVWNNAPPRFSWDNVLPKVTFNTGRNLIGTTHHESGTLWMGTDPTRSVTNEDGRFHHVDNAYVAGPALHPTAGSANPTL